MKNTQLYFDQVPLATVREIIEKRAVPEERGRNTTDAGRPTDCARASFTDRKAGITMETPPSGHPLELLYPEWQKPYRQAVVETDIGQMRQKIAYAEAIIVRRLRNISGDARHQAETAAIEDSLAFLRALRRDVLGDNSHRGGPVER